MISNAVLASKLKTVVLWKVKQNNANPFSYGLIWQAFLTVFIFAKATQLFFYSIRGGNECNLSAGVALHAFLFYPFKIMFRPISLLQRTLVADSKQHIVFVCQSNFLWNDAPTMGIYISPAPIGRVFKGNS